jgi:hypothetical protein
MRNEYAAWLKWMIKSKRVHRVREGAFDSREEEERFQAHNADFISSKAATLRVVS